MRNAQCESSRAVLIYLKFQTNRAKLREILALFQNNSVNEEWLIAPRPPLKERFRIYIGFASLENDSKNQHLLKSLKNYQPIHENVFKSEVANIQYFWEAGKGKSKRRHGTGSLFPCAPLPPMSSVVTCYEDSQTHGN